MIVGEAATTTFTTTKTTMETAPLAVITSPTRGELVEAGAVVIRGSATDGLSGLLGVSCNGSAATLDDTGFTCQVTVPVGTTTIEVRATDVAANVRTVTVEVTTVDDVGTTPPTGLRVSPSTATVVVGASRGFSVRDDLGRIPPGVAWSVDTEGVVSLAPAAGGVTVVAQAAGVVHVTASWQGLTADAEVTVLATVATMPEVVTLWSAPTVGGAVQRIVQGATTIDGTHRLYTYESTGEDDGQDVIRAFEADGREAWSAAAGGRVLQLSGDPSGGVVALVDDRPAYTTRLRVFGPNGSGGSGPVGVGPFAIHPNGPLYYVDQNNTLVGLDIGLGSGPGTTVAGTPGYPTVLADGSVVVPSVLDPQQFQLTFVRPGGAVETQTVNLPNGCAVVPGPSGSEWAGRAARAGAAAALARDGDAPHRRAGGGGGCRRDRHRKHAARGRLGRDRRGRARPGAGHLPGGVPGRSPGLGASRSAMSASCSRSRRRGIRRRSPSPSRRAGRAGGSGTGSGRSGTTTATATRRSSASRRSRRAAATRSSR